MSRPVPCYSPVSDHTKEKAATASPFLYFFKHTGPARAAWTRFFLGQSARRPLGACLGKREEGVNSKAGSRGKPALRKAEAASPTAHTEPQQLCLPHPARSNSLCKGLGLEPGASADAMCLPCPSRRPHVWRGGATRRPAPSSCVLHVPAPPPSSSRGSGLWLRAEGSCGRRQRGGKDGGDFIGSLLPFLLILMCSRCLKKVTGLWDSVGRAIGMCTESKTG